MRNLLKGVINPDVASGTLPSKNLHCIAKVGNLMFMHGGLMLDTIVEFMEKEKEKEINGNEFISKVDKLFQIYIVIKIEHDKIHSIFII